MTSTLGFFNLGGWEIAIIAVLGLLIFGKRLPEVGRSLGKGIVEFKKGLSGVQEEIENAGKGADDSNNKIEGNQSHKVSSESSAESTTKSS